MFSTLFQETKTKTATLFIEVVLGSVVLAFISNLAWFVPFTPVPLTLQTLCISLFTLFLGPKKASLIACTYLVEGTFGLPVFAGGFSNPLWFLGAKGGYLIGFCIAPLVAGYFLRGHSFSSPLMTWLKLSTIEMTILLCGCMHLSILGIEGALAIGVFPFIPGALIKTTLATCCALSRK